MGGEGAEAEGEGRGLGRYISGGKPVWVVVMNWPSACMRGPDDQRGLPSSREVTSPSRRDRLRFFFGQWRIACVKDAVSEPQRGGASAVWEFAPPGGVSSKVALACPHLMYSAGDKLVKAHKGVRGEPRRVGIIVRSGVESLPVVHKGVSGPPLEGEVCP